MLSFLKRNKDDPAPQQDSAPAGSWLSRLKAGLSATRGKLGAQLAGVLSRHSKIDEALFEELETLLISCDIGVASSQYLLEQARAARRAREAHRPRRAQARAARLPWWICCSRWRGRWRSAAQRPFVMLVAGVNGSGKTTSIGKLAKYYQTQGKSVMLAAGDTFRAAAVEQLKTWGERNQVSRHRARQGRSGSGRVRCSPIGAGARRGSC